MKEKDEKEFELDFPKDYYQENLAGKRARFKVKMNLVQKKELPELNDDFAKGLGRFESLKALKESLAEGMKLERKKESEDKWRLEVIEKIIAESHIELPDILVEQELDKMMAEFEQNVAAMGLKLETYLENVIKKSKSEIRESWSEAAEKRVQAALVLRKIAEVEKISVSKEEIEEEMNRFLAYYRSVAEVEKNVDLEGLYNYAKGLLTNEKVFKFLESL
jgi:trigger factor